MFFSFLNFPCAYASALPVSESGYNDCFVSLASVFSGFWRTLRIFFSLKTGLGVLGNLDFTTRIKINLSGTFSVDGMPKTQIPWMPLVSVLIWTPHKEATQDSSLHGCPYYGRAHLWWKQGGSIPCSSNLISTSLSNSRFPGNPSSVPCLGEHPVLDEDGLKVQG